MVNYGEAARAAMEEQRKNKTFSQPGAKPPVVPGTPGPAPEAGDRRPWSWLRPPKTGPVIGIGQPIPGPAPAVPATPAKYSPEYYAKIRDQYMGQAFSPEAQESARLERSRLAGMGVLSGTAYDVRQGERVGEIQRGADEAVRQAMLEGAEWESGADQRRKDDLDKQIALLAPYATDPNASQEIKDLYNKLLAERFGLTSPAPGQPGLPGAPQPGAPGAPPTDFLPPPSDTDVVKNLRTKYQTQLQTIDPQADSVFEALNSRLAQSRSESFNAETELKRVLSQFGGGMDESQIVNSPSPQAQYARQLIQKRNAAAQQLKQLEGQINRMETLGKQIDNFLQGGMIDEQVITSWIGMIEDLHRG